MIDGIGKETPIVTNEKGGKGSPMLYAFAWLDPLAMFALAKVVMQGREKYGTDENWRKVPAEDHLNHALTHIYAHLAGDRQDDHLEHAFCRLMMAVATNREDQRTPKKSAALLPSCPNPDWGKCEECIYGWDRGKDESPCCLCFDSLDRLYWSPRI